MRRIWLVILMAFILTAPLAEAKPPVKLAPPVVCTMHNRMDIFVDEDDIMWACECEALKSGHICRWQVIGGVDPVSIRKRHRRSTHGFGFTIPPVLVGMPHAQS